MMESEPITCTLAGRNLQDRLALIAALTRDALRGYERADLTLKLRYAIDARGAGLLSVSEFRDSGRGK